MSYVLTNGEAHEERLVESITPASPVASARLLDRVPVYLARRRTDIAAIEHALVVDDFPRIESIGHNMKGTGSSYGFRSITEIGALLELAAKAGNRAEIATLLSEISSYLQTIGRPVLP